MVTRRLCNPPVAPMNPYEPSQFPRGEAPDQVNRRQRSELAETIRRFLREELTAFELDNKLTEFRDSTDSAVRFVADAAWYHYDDCKDHLVALSKAEWDYFQRLLLLLESDRVVHTVAERRWHWSQLVAGLALVVFVLIALRTGWGYHLLLVAAPLGLVSIGIAHLRRTQDVASPYEAITFPFESFEDLRGAYAAARFRKVRYPRHLHSRQIRSPLLAVWFTGLMYALWLLLAPVALACQAFPLRITQTRVTTA